MINIVLPMAGAGRRFAEAGYDRPKPFIDVLGAPMIERVLEDLYFAGAKFILVAQRQHTLDFKDVLARLAQRYPVEVLTVDHVTEGATCTVLTAVRSINNDTPLLIANSDQILDLQVDDFVNDCLVRGLDGSVLTFWADHPKWSYAEVDSRGIITRIKEKEVISEHATAGLYFFARGQDFLYAAVDMITHNERVNNEFYVAPVYNYAIATGKRFGIYEMEVTAMHGLGTPEDLNAYLALQESASAPVGT